VRGRSAAALAIGLAVGALPAAAQTNDHVFRSWRWSENVEAPRAAGLAGAFVAVADDSSATYLNPAGLVLLPKTELSASLGTAGSGTITPLGDRFESRTDPGFIGGGGLVAKRLAVGAYVTRAHHSHVVFESTAPDVAAEPGFSTARDLAAETGFIDVKVTDAGAAVAWQPLSRVYVGARLNVRYLELEGLLSVSDQLTRSGVTVETFRVGLDSGDARTTVDFGALVQIADSVRFGAVHRTGASWGVNRTSRNPAAKIELDERPTELRSPSVLSAGLAWRLNPQVLLSAQVDYVLYSQLQSNLDIRNGAFAREDYDLSNAAEPRLGLELSRRVGGVSLQLRGGIHSQAPGSLRYTGPDTVEKLVFPATKRRTLVATGLSVISRVGLRLDSSALFQGEGTSFALGLAMRF
jgi:long-subunit fatty acid transport protein